MRSSETALMVGELFAGALNRKPHFRVVTSVTTVQEVLEKVRSVSLDVALISAALADGPLSGLRVLPKFAVTWSRMPSPLLSTSASADPGVSAPFA